MIRMEITDYVLLSPRILVIGPNWVGDMVMAQSLFITLKTLFPTCRIDVVAPTWTAPVLTMMPEVTKAIESLLVRGQLGLVTRYKMGKQLRQEKYDQVIVLPNSFKSALIPFFAKIPRRTGYVGEQRWGLLNDVRRLDKKALPMTVQRFVALGLDQAANTDFDCPPPILQINAQQLETICAKFSLVNRSQKILGLCPGAEYGPAKCWPAEKYAELAREKINQGWEVWLFGSPKDRRIAVDINQATDNKCIDLSGQTSLTEAVNLLSLCDYVVSNDSGLMHVAAALDRNLVVIYGSSDSGFTPPINQRASIVSLSLDCSPCFKRECPLGHYKCLRDISAQMISNELDIF